MITKNELNVKHPEELILNEEKFRDHKLMTNDLIIKLDRCEFDKQSEMVAGCGSWLLFSHQQNMKTFELRKRLKLANFCKFRFCPMCNWRRSRNLGRSLIKGLTDISQTQDIEFIFLTLTIKNPPVNKLKETIKHMNAAFKRMIQTKKYKQAVLGHFKALEILGDNTPVGEAHPHFHCFLIVPKSYFTSRYYIKQGEWQEMWKKALRVDYELSVDVRKIRVKKNSKLTALQSAVFEVAKYAVKSSELTSRSDEDFKEIINQTYRVRFYSTGGLLKKVINLKKIEEDLIDSADEVESEWQEIEELLYNWKEGNYHLKSISTTISTTELEPNSTIA